MKFKRVRKSIRWIALFAVMGLLFTGLQLGGGNGSFGAASTVRINAGGSAQNVNGTTWSGCTSVSACNGYVSGGFPWAQKPVPNVSGYSGNSNAAVHQTEWTGGSTNGVAYGATAFTFAIPVVANNDYNVALHFTELNKTAAGQRVFDVKIDGNTVLSNFDVFQQAGGEYKTIIRTFPIHDTAGKITISFIRRTENAKVDAIEIVPANGNPTTSTISKATTTTVASSGGGFPSSTHISWSKIANPPFRSAESSGGIINNKMYLFGGFQPGSWTTPTTSAAVYDIATNKWSSLPSAPYGISHAARVIWGHSFILAGAVAEVGGKETFAVNKVLVFNADTNKWSYLPDLPQARGSAGAALIGSQLHVFGGVDGNRNVHGDHWVLDLNNPGAGWKTLASFPSPRSHYAAVVINNNSIYTVGGLTGWENTTVEKQDTWRYDVPTNKWTRMADTPIAISHVSEATMVINGNVWMFGGEPKYPNATSSIYVYNIASNKWEKASSSLPQARFAGVADHIGNTVYYLNGTVYDSSVWKGTIG